MPSSESEPRRAATWSEYQRWPDDQRIEIVGGVVYDMTPAPLVRHQIVSGNLEEALGAFFKGKSCRVLHAPLDLKLSEEDVVQPDIMVVCDASKIRSTHIEVYTLTSDGYRLHGGYEDRHTLRSAAFAGISIELAPVFDFPIDPEERIQVVREARLDEIAALVGGPG